MGGGMGSSGKHGLATKLQFIINGLDLGNFQWINKPVAGRGVVYRMDVSKRLYKTQEPR